MPVLFFSSNPRSTLPPGVQGIIERGLRCKKTKETAGQGARVEAGRHARPLFSINPRSTLLPDVQGIIERGLRCKKTKEAAGQGARGAQREC